MKSTRESLSIGNFLYPLLYVGIIVLIIWLGVKFDLGETSESNEVDTTLEVGQQYGGR